jgi:hypothetical protein
MRILDLILSLKIKDSYIVGDAYYWSGELSKKIRRMGNHLVSRVKTTAVAYLYPDGASNGVGRPKIYGEKIKLKNLFRGGGFISAIVELYGKKEKIQYKERILLCKNHQCPIKYIFTKIDGNHCIFSSTDIQLSALEIIELYSHRFKIEYSFKGFVHDFGGFCYRFWSKSIDRSRKKDVAKRDPVVERAFQLHLQIAVIAQGLANILAIKYSDEVWKAHHSWMRTIRPGILPSSTVVRIALTNTLPSFIGLGENGGIFTKFIKKRLRIDKMGAFKMSA